ncbi:hypothetical protein Pyrde_0357 [Pyrodictium delaneyi]|uniref:MFS transporter n=1 Tax=Pyrodictium delaneyi TaxID=1273541 RepID=A0A0P0N1F0_9CREN|nr:MFS transporter [Pyrodictium delaneyi]ALL00407.1 hypothetical protein Pyrde_0357 [Pyrodictium delaneyi]OWJ53886.1 MFS transporter [Pyrodictium delaneyi]
MKANKEAIAAGSLTIVLLFGVVSLLGDMSYEGFRSVLPVFIPGGLELSSVAGLGEVIAWSLRPVTGLVADRLGAYWGFTILGYSMIPLGILVASLGGPMLVLGYSIERLGKALRSPSRDALLAGVAGKRRGLVFGIHETMDQVGAIVGPLIAYITLSRGMGLWLLSIPGLLTVFVLLFARSLYPRGARPRPKKVGIREALHWSKGAVLYVVIAGTLVASPLAVEHVARTLGGVTASSAPLLYAAAMLSDAFAAVPLGMLYDRQPKTATSIPVVMGATAGIVAVLLGDTLAGALVAALLSGIAEAGFETVARAMVRGGATGYGFYGLARGVAAAGSIALYSVAASMLA